MKHSPKPYLTRSPRAFAFFDVDETIVTEKTMFSILNVLANKETERDADEIRHKLSEMRKQGFSREIVNRAFYRGLTGLFQHETFTIARAYIRKRIADDQSDPFFIPSSVAKLKALRASNIMPVFVSGSAHDFITAIAEHLGVSHILATRLQTDEQGRYTGEIAGPCMIGEGKTQAVKAFMMQHSADPAQCYGFGDHPSDAGFISLLGHGSIVAGHLVAEKLARKYGWEILPCKTNIEGNIQ